MNVLLPGQVPASAAAAGVELLATDFTEAPAAIDMVSANANPVLANVDGNVDGKHTAAVETLPHRPGTAQDCLQRIDSKGLYRTPPTLKACTGPNHPSAAVSCAGCADVCCWLHWIWIRFDLCFVAVQPKSRNH